LTRWDSNLESPRGRVARWLAEILGALELVPEMSA
jgi:hypothetical protein